MSYRKAYCASRPLLYRAHIAVRNAVVSGDLPRPEGLKCEDCGKDAKVYDHRDYTRPLDVAPVCRGCNRRRGPGHPYADAPPRVIVRDAFHGMLKSHPRGTIANVAAACGVSWSAVWQWREVPAEHVAKVEAVTGIPRHRLRPDLYPIAREAIAPAEVAA